MVKLMMYHDELFDAKSEGCVLSQSQSKVVDFDGSVHGSKPSEEVMMNSFGIISKQPEVNAMSRAEESWAL